MISDFKEFVINILGYRDDDGWVALAIDMDLRGHGETFDAALEELKELVDMQISFALDKGLPSMIWHPAEDVWIEKWNQARREWISDLVTGHTEGGGDRAGSIVPDVPPAFIGSSGSQYTRVNV